MKQIKRLKQHRWFIWAIVVSVAGLVFLATYVYSTAVRDESEIPVNIQPSQNVVTSKVSVKLPVSQANAVYLVRNIADVQAYLRTHSRARVVADDKINNPVSQTPYWPVHVYEDLKEHAKNFGWYNIYVESGVIVKQ